MAAGDGIDVEGENVSGLGIGGIVLRMVEFAAHVNLPFLIPLFAGVGASLFTLGKALAWLFQHYPTLVWSFFFGLILASVYYVSKNIKQRSGGVFIGFAVGLAIAGSMVLMKPAAENAACRRYRSSLSAGHD